MFGALTIMKARKLVGLRRQRGPEMRRSEAALFRLSAPMLACVSREITGSSALAESATMLRYPGKRIASPWKNVVPAVPNHRHLRASMRRAMSLYSVTESEPYVAPTRRCR